MTNRERFVSPAALPTPYQRELLTILMEECGEVVQRCSKALRFGLLEVQPGQELTNATRLAHEIGDVLKMVEVLEVADAISGVDVDDGAARKARNLVKYMQTTPSDDDPCGKNFPGRPERCFLPKDHRPPMHRAWLYPPGCGQPEEDMVWHDSP